MKLKETYPYYLGNKPKSPNQAIEVIDKYTGEVASRVPQCTLKTLKEAIGISYKCFKEEKRLAGYERREVLEHCIMRFKERYDELAYALSVETGKPVKDARGEASRLIDTFKIAAEEAVRINGQTVNFDISERSKSYNGFWQRFPIGPCAFITPFNFPLNLVAHKVAPAIAMGNPFVLKPSLNTPLGALMIGEILSETSLPEGYFSILPCKDEDAYPMVEDERIKLLSFTGSQSVGWDIKRRAGKKKVLLELGGNAGCIVCEDADIKDAVGRIIFGAFYQSGQSCISVQRIYVQEGVYDRFKEELVREARRLKSGDPKLEETFVGPMISEGEAVRVEGWIEEALEGGGKVLCGGKRRGAVVEATVVEKTPIGSKLCMKEVFGPVVNLFRYESFAEALSMVNGTEYGLQAGIFTKDINKALRGYEELEVGGVLINEMPSFRVDNMPYGGIKESGNTREGIKYAMEEMSELKLLVIRRM